MILEIATIEILPGKEYGFERGVRAAKPLFDRAPGCHGVSLRRIVERPSTYLLLVEWESVQAHTEGFQKSADFQEWRSLVGPFFASRPAVEHSESISLADDP